MEKPKLYLVGASHGVKIGDSLRKIPGVTDSFELKIFSIRGARFSSLVFPSEKICKEQDILCIIPFGNDLIERNSVFKNHRDGRFHLVKYKPIRLTKLHRLCVELLHKLQKFPGKIFVIDNFFRLLCCKSHFYSNWLNFQKTVNREIRDWFSSIKTVKVTLIDHRDLISKNRKKSKNIAYYISLQQDSVHFSNYDKDF